MALELSDKNFGDEIKSFKGIALVDFWAPWCGPCKIQGPIVEELSVKLKDKSGLKIAKLNVDDNQSTSTEYEILSIPTIKIFKDGQPVDELIGLQNQDSLTRLINKYIS